MDKVLDWIAWSMIGRFVIVGVLVVLMLVGYWVWALGSWLWSLV